VRRGLALDSCTITIEVHDDAVTLRGTVRSCRERRKAEEAALRFPGVTFVNNLLTVGESSKGEDPAGVSETTLTGSERKG